MVDQKQQKELRVPVEVVDDREIPYYYYDMLNVVAGVSEIVLEFGNSVRNESNKMRVAHRAVLSVPAAFKLQQGLSQTLQMLQKRLQELQQQALKNQNEE